MAKKPRVHFRGRPRRAIRRARRHTSPARGRLAQAWPHFPPPRAPPPARPPPKLGTAFPPPPLLLPDPPPTLGLDAPPLLDEKLLVPDLNPPFSETAVPVPTPPAWP
ncbi:MAG TPA: hypothetical protein VJA25_01700, partial [Dehalococcoidia bacterium]|nr:hypothetical protein [Dehalococcoidia bacterium]